MKYFFGLVVVGLVFGCSRSTVSEGSEDVDSLGVDEMNLVAEDSASNFDYLALESYAYAESVDTSQVDVIDKDCALIVYPTDQQIEDMKKEYGEDDFYTLADDAMFYQSSASENLDSVGIQSLAMKKRYIRFKGANRSWDLDIRKKGAPEWNIILFKRDKAPKVVTGIDLTVDSVKTYFNK